MKKRLWWSMLALSLALPLCAQWVERNAMVMGQPDGIPCAGLAQPSPFVCMTHEDGKPVWLGYLIVARDTDSAVTGWRVELTFRLAADGTETTRAFAFTRHVVAEWSHAFVWLKPTDHPPIWPTPYWPELYRAKLIHWRVVPQRDAGVAIERQEP